VHAQQQVALALLVVAVVGVQHLGQQKWVRQRSPSKTLK
jgi:hypothetical protein